MRPEHNEIVLYHYEGIPDRDIAEIVGYSKNFVNSTINRYCEAPCHNPNSPIRNGGPCVCPTQRFTLIPHHLNCPGGWDNGKKVVPVLTARKRKELQLV